MGHFQIAGLSWNGNKIGRDSCRNEEDGSSDGGREEGKQNDNDELIGENSVSPGMSIGCSSVNSIQIRAKSNCDNMDVMAGIRKHN